MPAPSLLTLGSDSIPGIYRTSIILLPQNLLLRGKSYLRRLVSKNRGIARRIEHYLSSYFCTNDIPKKALYFILVSSEYWTLEYSGQLLSSLFCSFKNSLTRGEARRGAEKNVEFNKNQLKMA